MFDTRKLATLAALAALLGAPLVAADLPPICQPAPHHSNYGLDKNGAWCPWDQYNVWKPEGVGCKTDAECQRGGKGGTGCLFPFTNGKDVIGIQVDIILIEAVGFCDGAADGGPGTQCDCAIPPIGRHLGGKKDYPAGPGQTPLAECREIMSKIGFPGAGIATGCRIPFEDMLVVQCMYTCNGDENTCPPGSDPKAYHKAFEQLPDCPGYKSYDY